MPIAFGSPPTIVGLEKIALILQFCAQHGTETKTRPHRAGLV